MNVSPCFEYINIPENIRFSEDMETYNMFVTFDKK